MKRFNPEKELKKSRRKYTKKHLVFSLLGLIGLTILGISFAYYNVDYSSVLVNGNVDAPINISVMKGEEQVTDFPTLTDGYKFDRVECINSSSYTWDEESWRLYIDFIGSDDCVVYFIEKLEYEFAYTGDYQIFTVPKDGSYKIELWGASGGTNAINIVGGSGAYVKGNINLIKGELLYIYVGSQPTSHIGGYNGGGNASLANGYYMGGGGATDIRTVGGSWNLSTSLNSRIAVAGAGAGGGSYFNDPSWMSSGGPGGGLTGVESLTAGDASDNYPITVPTQTSGGISHPTLPGTPGVFGQGGNGYTNNTGSGTGGGSGYYGAAGGSFYAAITSGGTSYMSGHTGAVAITSETDQTPLSGCTTGTTDVNCSHHYSGYIFTDTVMIDGAGYSWSNVKGSLSLMPNTTGEYYASGEGHYGDGYAIITFIG